LGYKRNKLQRIFITSTIFLHLVFLVLYGDLILNFFACFILLVLNLDWSFLFNKKPWRTWTYRIYMCWNNICHKTWKIHLHSKTKIVGEIFCCFFFVVNDINIHQLNFGSFRILDFLVKHPFKKIIVLHLFNNKCIIIYIFRKQITTIWKRKRFYRWALHYVFSLFLFGNVLWTTKMRPYGCQKNIKYILYVHCFYPILFMLEP